MIENNLLSTPWRENLQIRSRCELEPPRTVARAQVRFGDMSLDSLCGVAVDCGVHRTARGLDAGARRTLHGRCCMVHVDTHKRFDLHAKCKNICKMQEHEPTHACETSMFLGSNSISRCAVRLRV